MSESHSTSDACLEGAKMALEGSKRAFFFGKASEPNFGVLHAPRSGVTAGNAGVLLCGPLGHEHAFSRRMFVEWSRVLSGEGLWALRFDYRGHGDSGGSFEDYELRDYLEDIGAACAELERRSGVSIVILCGLRFGATLAALWARDNRPDSPAILWEPVLSGRAYLGELRRIELVKKIAERSGASRSEGKTERPHAAADSLFVEGHEWTREARTSIEGVDLHQVLGGLALTPLMVRIAGPADGSGTAAPGKVDAERPEASVTTSPPVSAPPLWYGSFVKEYRTRCRPENLFEATVPWIRKAVVSHEPPAPVGGSGGGPPPRRFAEPTQVSTGAANEVARLVFEGVSMREVATSIPTTAGVLRGVFTLPETEAPGGPLVVLSPQGFNPRAGWNRLYVRLARGLAAKGFRCLRFDARGLGESDGGVDIELGAEVFLAIEQGLHVDDATQAVSHAIERCGDAPVIVGGVCGGAITAALLGSVDRRVAGIALLEMPFVLTQSPGTKEPQPLWRYREMLLSPSSWRRLLSLRADFALHFKSLREFLLSRREVRRKGTGESELRVQLGTFANLKLVAALRLCFQRGLPTLFVFGDSENRRTFDHVRSLILGPPHDGQAAPVTEKVVEGADHNFLLPQHAMECRDALAAWMRKLHGVGRAGSQDGVVDA